MKLKNVKVGARMFLAFGLVMAILVLTVLIINFSLNGIKRNGHNTTRGAMFTDKVMESKYGLRSDQLYLMEIIGASGVEELEQNVKLHMDGIKKINEDISGALEVLSDVDWLTEEEQVKTKYKSQLESVKMSMPKKLFLCLNNAFN